MQNLSKKIIVIAGFLAITQTFFIMKGHEEHKEKPKVERLDVYNASFKALLSQDLESVPDQEQLKTNSRKQEFLTGRIVDSDISVLSNHKDPLQKRSSDKQQVFQIASITKTFSAATAVKIAADKKYSKFFDSEDPLDTPISSFLPLIRKHGNENVQAYFEQLGKSHPDFQKITLRICLNHSSGVHYQEFFDDFRQDQSKPFHLKDRYSPPVVLADAFGTFNYSDANYNNIVAPILEAVVSEVENQPIKFSDLVRDRVIEPLGLSQTYTPDEVTLNPDLQRIEVLREKESKSSIDSKAPRSQINVSQGFDYFNGDIQYGQDFNYDLAAGGMLSTSAEVAKFYQSLLDESLFTEDESRIFFDERNYIHSEHPNNKPGKMFEGYGLGIRRIAAGNTEYFHHGGAGIGSYSHVIASRNNDNGFIDVAATTTSYENLTRPIATEILQNRKINEREEFFVDDELGREMDRLNKEFSKDQLIQMRKSLDKSKEEFEKTYQLMTSSGLNPDSPEIIDYINASENWEDIQKVIGNFHQIINDPDRSEGEQIDAKGYFAICQFKVLGYLSKGDEEQRQEKLEDLKAKNIFSVYFGIADEDVRYKAVFDKTKEYSENLRKECLGKEDYPHQSALNAALAGLMKLPMYIPNLEQKDANEALSKSCKQYAREHLYSAKKAAYLGEKVGNGRGYINLKSAYKNFCDKPPYNKTLDEPVLEEDSIAIQRESVEKAAKLGYKYAHVELGNYAQKQGDLEGAKRNYEIAAKAGYVKASKALEGISKQELKEEKSGEEKSQDRISLKALDLAGLDKTPSPSPEKTHAEKMVSQTKDKAYEI